MAKQTDNDMSENCPHCETELELDEGTQPTCINGDIDEGIESCHYCEECGYEREVSND